jgi:hypothetical protein
VREQVGECFPKAQQNRALPVQAEAKTTDLIVKVPLAKTATASEKLSCFSSFFDGTARPSCIEHELIIHENGGKPMYT